ncbi:hypothetical protein AAY473_036716 [Plecturocebus cupreus]
MNARGHHWLSNVRLTKYQGLLCENPHITIEVCNTLNPVTLLPMSEGPAEHNCVEVLDTVYSSRPDLWDQPWTIVDWELERCAGYTVATLGTVMEAKSLPQGTLAQKAELTALTQALELSKDKVRMVVVHCRGHQRPTPPWPWEIPELIQQLIRQHLPPTEQQLQSR